MGPRNAEGAAETPTCRDTGPLSASGVDLLENGVLAVLTGEPVHQAAKRHRLGPADLDDAVDRYQAAGRAALRSATDQEWFQANIRFTNWSAAEHLAARLAVRLMEAEATGAIGDWWFLRKHPCWRFRCRPGPEATMSMTRTAMATILDGLLDTGEITTWWPSTYEPEVAAFGGTHGMDIAHRLFHADSRGVLDLLHRQDRPDRTRPRVGRREMSVLLFSTLMRSAGLEWHEQADVWHRVTLLRPFPPGTRAAPGHPPGNMTGALPLLLTADTSPTGALVTAGGPLEYAAPWLLAFAAAGRDLGKAGYNGVLERGLRDVIAHLVIFHWNRLGLTDQAQALLAQTAREVILNPTRPTNRAAASSAP